MARIIFSGNAEERQRIQEALQQAGCSIVEMDREQAGREMEQRVLVAETSDHLLKTIKRSYNPRIPFRLKGNTRVVWANDILYISKIASAKKFHVHLIDGEKLEASGTMANMLKELPDQFYSPHEAYIVNIHHTEGHRPLGGNKSEIFLINGDTIPVSHRKRALVVERLQTTGSFE